MIPIIHVVGSQIDTVVDINTNANTKTTIFVFKEDVDSQFYSVIGQHVKGNTRQDFTLYLLKDGVKQYINTVFQYDIRISFITMHEEYLCSCPVWSYEEIRRRVSASYIHLLDLPTDNRVLLYVDIKKQLKNYLDIIENSDFYSVAYTEDWEQWNRWSNWDDLNPSENWQGDDY